MSRRFRPAIDGLESRELMSVVPYYMSRMHQGAAQVYSAVQSGAIGGGGAAARLHARATASSLYPAGSPLIPPSAQPTPHELAREGFFGSFAGPVQRGPGRFVGQSQIYNFRGLGTSNQFLHGDYNMAIVIPSDPAAPITGLAVLEDKNSASAGILGLDLTADPGSLDRFGRPTHLTFTADPSIFSGIYFSAAASGTVDIRYAGPKAQAIFHGLVYTTGLTNPVVNSPQYANG